MHMLAVHILWRCCQHCFKPNILFELKPMVEVSSLCKRSLSRCVKLRKERRGDFGWFWYMYCFSEVWNRNSRLRSSLSFVSFEAIHELLPCQQATSWLVTRLELVRPQWWQAVSQASKLSHQIRTRPAQLCPKDFSSFLYLLPLLSLAIQHFFMLIQWHRHPQRAAKISILCHPVHLHTNVKSIPAIEGKTEIR